MDVQILDSIQPFKYWDNLEFKYPLYDTKRLNNLNTFALTEKIAKFEWNARFYGCCVLNVRFTLTFAIS